MSSQENEGRNFGLSSLRKQNNKSKFSSRVDIVRFRNLPKFNPHSEQYSSKKGFNKNFHSSCSKIVGLIEVRLQGQKKKDFKEQ